MFEYLTKHAKVIVTGPQRSGTTICAKMVAHDTGYEFIDEDSIRVHHLELLKEILRDKSKFVVQCPALCAYVDQVADDETAVLLMRRKIEDITSSQRRIRWRCERDELRRYGVREGPIAEVKYRYWDEVQKNRLGHAYEVAYDSLAAHPLWIPQEQRKNFHPKQTSR